jgi:hypothetical protein
LLSRNKIFFKIVNLGCLVCVIPIFGQCSLQGWTCETYILFLSAFGIFTYEEYTIFLCIKCLVASNHSFVIIKWKTQKHGKNSFVNISSTIMGLSGSFMPTWARFCTLGAWPIIIVHPLLEFLESIIDLGIYDVGYVGV